MPFLGLSSWLERFRPWVMARLVPAILADHRLVGSDRTGLCIARVDERLRELLESSRSFGLSLDFRG